MDAELDGRARGLGRVEAVPDRLDEQERLPLSAVRNRLASVLVKVLPFGVDPPDASLEDVFLELTSPDAEAPASPS